MSGWQDVDKIEKEWLENNPLSDEDFSYWNDDIKWLINTVRVLQGEKS